MINNNFLALNSLKILPECSWIMHEHSPRMSVAQGLVASTSQSKSEIIIEVPRYEMIAEEPKETENLDMDLKIAYVNPNSGTYIYTFNSC